MATKTSEGKKLFACVRVCVYVHVLLGDHKHTVSLTLCVTFFCLCVFVCVFLCVCGCVFFTVAVTHGVKCSQARAKTTA